MPGLSRSPLTQNTSPRAAILARWTSLALRAERRSTPWTPEGNSFSASPTWDLPLFHDVYVKRVLKQTKCETWCYETAKRTHHPQGSPSAPCVFCFLFVLIIYSCWATGLNQSRCFTDRFTSCFGYLFPSRISVQRVDVIFMAEILKMKQWIDYLRERDDFRTL